VEITVLRRQSKDVFLSKWVLKSKTKAHNGFGHKLNQATTNGVFEAKILQINIVRKWRFLYNFPA
jgi:hypothetical protein